MLADLGKGSLIDVWRGHGCASKSICIKFYKNVGAEAILKIEKFSV